MQLVGLTLLLNGLDHTCLIVNNLVELFDVTFSLECITCGVPQGSILGPLLFLVYVNDMEIAVKCKLQLYADDSVLLISSKNLGELELKLSNELSSVSDWLVDNRLSLHLFCLVRNTKSKPSLH